MKPSLGRRSTPRLVLYCTTVALLGASLQACDANKPATPGARGAEVTPGTPAPQTTGSGSSDAGAPARPALSLLGHHDLGGDGMNGDVHGLGDFAYVGEYGGRKSDQPCPADGIKAVDISNPRKPKLASVIPNPDGTSAEDVVAVSAATAAFQGDVLVTGIQACDGSSDVFRGLIFYDVTDPHRPKELGRWPAPASTFGCHEIDMAVRAQGDRQRLLAGCALPLAEPEGHDEAVLIDASDPRRPKVIGGFAAGKDLGIDIEKGKGCFPVCYAHNVRFTDGATRLYVSYWDSGTMTLDITRPRKPRHIGTTSLNGIDPDADNHSMALAGDLLLINSEDASPRPQIFGDGFTCATSTDRKWGRLHIFDNSDPAKTKLLATFGTPHSLGKLPGSGGYSIHNTEVVGDDQVFASWYSDGIRWIDLSDPTKPREVAKFVPPKIEDPQRLLRSAPFVWGVYPSEDQDVILASDIHSGLWILEPRGLGDF